jgi:hypothetical protein
MPSIFPQGWKSYIIRQAFPFTGTGSNGTASLKHLPCTVNESALHQIWTDPFPQIKEMMDQKLRMCIWLGSISVPTVKSNSDSLLKTKRSEDPNVPLPHYEDLIWCGAARELICAIELMQQTENVLSRRPLWFQNALEPRHWSLSPRPIGALYQSYSGVGVGAALHFLRKQFVAAN